MHRVQRARSGSASPDRVRACLAFAELAGCTGADVDLNPLYVGRVAAAAPREESRTHSLGPLWDDAREPGQRVTALHPFWRRVATPEAVETQVLDPIYNARTTADGTTHHVLAWTWSRSHGEEGAPKDYDFVLFPLLFLGNGASDDEDYFALFPIAGQIKAFAGFAEVGFVLFPAYYWTRKDVTSDETLHSVTPLFGWADGGPRDGSWRVLPLAAHWRWEGKHERWSFLWPIFHRQHNRLDTSDPSTLTAVWPLFSWESSARTRFLAFLWPLFRFRTERVARAGTDGMPYEEVYYHHDFLWPLYRREHLRDYDAVRLFPFYSRFRSEELDSDAWAIPLLWHRVTREAAWTKETFDFVPLVHWEEKRFRSGAEPDSAFRFWPFFGWKRVAGARELTVPALLPLDVGRYTGDFLENWGPLVELWRTRTAADGSVRGNALLRLVDWEARGGRRRFSLPLVWSWEDDGRRRTHDLLLGLVRFGGGEGGPEFRLLGMPLLVPEVAPR